MKDLCRFAAAGAFLASIALIAQNGRDAYRQAFDTWTQAQSNIERDAGTEGTALVPRVDRAAAAAASFETTRAAYLKSSVEEAAQDRKLLPATTTPPAPDVPQTASELVAREQQAATRTIARFAGDKDRAIQQLRQSLERERDTLTALNQSIQARQKAVAAATNASTVLEQARTKAADAFAEQTSRTTQSISGLDKESAAWADYYEKLTRAIQAAIAPPPPPPPSVTPAPPRSTSIAPVPLARYVGDWTYPATNGIFHGTPPASVDLVVHEQGGHADGTLSARFKLPPGSSADPVVRFDFQGDFGPAINQRFPLVTSDGAQGTVELIPGPAFNLLEVNFQIVPRPNRMSVGNFILVKK